jgi:hypothetical protein
MRDGSLRLNRGKWSVMNDATPRRPTLRRVLSVSMTVMVLVAPASGSFGVQILSFPVGLVVGEQTIEVGFDASEGPVVLYLDGEPVCSPPASRPQCRVNLGEAPLVHLLELVQRGHDGGDIATARRWLNRPGREAELSILLEHGPSIAFCTGRAQWFHPDKLDPIDLDVTDNGRPLLVGDDRQTFRFPCSDSDLPRVITGSAIFPDGRRAETVAVSGIFGSGVEASLTSVALVAPGSRAPPCAAIASSGVVGIEPVENSDFEVVFVLDPSANYQYLMSTGWSKVRLPTGSSVKVNPDYFMHQSSSGGAEPKDSWRRAVRSLVAAEKMWLVLPDEKLQRANGFGRGKDSWLQLLFQFGSSEADRAPRIADAVAASGLVAAAGPRRRAVVLILGKKSGIDASQFSPQHARDYLAEVGVPLFVLRSGKPEDDGWPPGMQVKNMEAMATSLEYVRRSLDQQCIAWFEGDVSPARVSSQLPSGLAVAGRRLGDVDPHAVEQQSETGPVGQDATVDNALQTRVDITAVTVLITARDPSGNPVTNLAASEISVLENGQSVSVLELEPLTSVAAAPPPGQATKGADRTTQTPFSEGCVLPVVIFADLAFSGVADIFAGVDLLAERSDWLASLGPVTVVEARKEVRTVVDRSQAANNIRNALLKLAEEAAGLSEIEQIRSRFLRNNGAMRDQGVSSNPSEEGLIPSVRFAIHEEDHAVRRHLDRIQSWAESESSTKPGLLLVVGAGFDEDPREFYQPTVELRSPENAVKVNLESRDLGLRRSQWVDALGKELAADGWLVVPIVGRTVGFGGSTIAAENSGRGRLNEFYSSQGTAVGTFASSWLQADPLGSHRHLAAPSGGDVILSQMDLNAIIERSSGWYRMTYQVDHPAAGVYRELDVSATREGVVLQTTGVVLSGTSEGRTETRLRQLLEGSREVGELPVEVSVSDPYQGEDGVRFADATVAVSFEPIAPLFVDGSERTLRFSIAVMAENDEPVIHHQLATATGALGGMYFDVPIEWFEPFEVLAVIVEDLDSGTWGSSKSDLAGSPR